MESMRINRFTNPARLTLDLCDDCASLLSEGIRDLSGTLDRSGEIVFKCPHVQYPGEVVEVKV